MKCREFGGTLVQIDSKEENDWLLKTLPKGIDLAFFV